jgi:diguanylate cyclase
MSRTLNIRKIARNLALMATFFGLLGAVGIFEPVSLLLYTVQKKINVKPVSGDIVIVGVDEKSISELGAWPWPRAKQAEVLRAIDAQEPKKVVVDIVYRGKTTAADDSALGAAFADMKAPTAVIAFATGTRMSETQSLFSSSDISQGKATVSAYVPTLFNYIWSIPTSVKSPKGYLPSIAAYIAAKPLPKQQIFRIDYGFDPDTIPIYSASDLVEGKISHNALQGKSVVFGLTDPTLNDKHNMPGRAERAGPMFQVMGAETLKNGMPTDLGWLPAFLVAILCCGLLLTTHGLRYSRSLSGLSCAVILAGSTGLTILNIGNDPIAAIGLIILAAVYVGRQKAALVRAQRNADTGLSDMGGYAINDVVTQNWLIAATPEITRSIRTKAMPDDALLITREIVRRLSAIINLRDINQNDAQQLIWEMPALANDELAAHLDGIRRLISTPFSIDGRAVQIDIFFGVDRDTASNLKLRTERALDASELAKSLEVTYKIASGSISIGQLAGTFAADFEAAIADKSASIVLEPIQRMDNALPIGAEATLRWAHPAYGQLNATQLWGLAQKSGQLDNYSLQLSRLAMAAAARISSERKGFQICVEMMVETLACETVQSAIDATRQEERCPIYNIVFKIMNVHDHLSNEKALKSIAAFQAKGYQIGLGNYGLTNADIELITIIKPKILFIAPKLSTGLLGTASNKIFAEAAIRIAKLHNIQTVADDIDDRAIFDQLKSIGCYSAKGKSVNNALSFSDFKEKHIMQKSVKYG